MKRRQLALAAFALATAVGFASLARADMVLNQVIVDLMPGNPPRGDIEVWNNGPERLYVSADPFEIRNPGLAAEQRVPANDPEQSGLLVAPQKLVLAPGERRTIRIAALGERPAQDRIYRVAIRPVAGPVTADRTALKVFVGYDTLILVRPARFTDDVVGQRQGRTLTLKNSGNTAQELFEGKQCNVDGSDCRSLPAKRLYSGEAWSQALPFETVVTYKAAIGPTIRDRRF